MSYIPLCNTSPLVGHLEDDHAGHVWAQSWEGMQSDGDLRRKLASDGIRWSWKGTATSTLHWHIRSFKKTWADDIGVVRIKATCGRRGNWSPSIQRANRDDWFLNRK